MAARFGAASIQELVDMFNQSVGNRGWTSVRALVVKQRKERSILIDTTLYSCFFLGL